MTNINIKTEAQRFGFFVLLSLLLFNCKQEEKLTSRQIVERSIEAHGGLKNWSSLKQLSFDKETTLFNADGSIEIKTEQFQLFRMQPTLFGKIEWESNGDDISIIYEDEKVSKIINDSIITSVAELEKAKSRFFAAQYVVFQPFELLNEGAELIYSNPIELEGRKTYAITIKYANDTEDSNKWTYYIDANTFKVIANKVELTDHTSWVENLTLDTATDFKFNAHRKSYRLNEAEEKTYLRAEYFYTNFSVQYQE